MFSHRKSTVHIMYVFAVVYHFIPFTQHTNKHNPISSVIMNRISFAHTEHTNSSWINRKPARFILMQLRHFFRRFIDISGFVDILALFYDSKDSLGSDDVVSLINWILSNIIWWVSSFLLKKIECSRNSKFEKGLHQKFNDLIFSNEINFMYSYARPTIK